MPVNSDYTMNQAAGTEQDVEKSFIWGKQTGDIQITFNYKKLHVTITRSSSIGIEKCVFHFKDRIHAHVYNYYEELSVLIYTEANFPYTLNIRGQTIEENIDAVLKIHRFIKNCCFLTKGLLSKEQMETLYSLSEDE